MQILPHVVMTSKDRYEPQQGKFVEHIVHQNSSKQTTIANEFNVRRRPVSDLTLEDWQANLG